MASKTDELIQNSITIAEQCVVVFATFLLTYESNYYNALTWYTFAISFIAIKSTTWILFAGLLLASAAPTLTLSSIMGNILATAYVTYKQYAF